MKTINGLSAFIEKHNQATLHTQIENDYILNISEQNIIINNAINKVIDRIHQALNYDATGKQLRAILIRELKATERDNLDTDEAEYIAGCFSELSQIIGVDIKNSINKWMYGAVLGNLVTLSNKLRSKNPIKVLSQDCSVCGTALKTEVVREEDGRVDFSWVIVQCNSCKGYNLLHSKKGVVETQTADYTFVDQLPKELYTEDQANIRLKQIMDFRK